MSDMLPTQRFPASLRLTCFGSKCHPPIWLPLVEMPDPLQPTRTSCTMSHLSFKSYKGVGEDNFEEYGYSQSVEVGDVLYISGQGALGTLNTWRSVC
jgi:enamine deaminase RidA (YjgF/YER057c/UK114 family)